MLYKRYLLVVSASMFRVKDLPKCNGKKFKKMVDTKNFSLHTIMAHNKSSLLAKHKVKMFVYGNIVSQCIF